jgi:hypothetical protein
LISQILYSLVPSALFLVTVYAVLGFLYLYKFSRKSRRSPLTQHLLRSPGTSLRNDIEDISVAIDSYLIVLFSLPVMLYASYLSQMYLGAGKRNIGSILVYVLFTAALTILLLAKVWRSLKKRSSLYLALDCELAVGQEFNNLMVDGYRVYHDFPAEKFNIDHVVVGPKGVFAVETKGRAKKNKKGGTAEATVVYDGNGLQFPGRFEKEPIDQAKRQAKWLSTWLSSAVGDAVSVKPVLVLPGWFIELRKPADVFIFNGKTPQSLVKGQRENILSETMIKRIAHQLEQRCRNVEPVAYKKK